MGGEEIFKEVIDGGKEGWGVGSIEGGKEGWGVGCINWGKEGWGVGRIDGGKECRGVGRDRRRMEGLEEMNMR